MSTSYPIARQVVRVPQDSTTATVTVTFYNADGTVRDLSSAKELWALPMLGKDAKTVVDSLTALAQWYGAPLVLKADNDGVFGARTVKDWAEANGVLMLYSPP